VADLEVSTLYITKDHAYRGRCILALKEHKTEMFQLSSGDAEAFGDTYPHLHFHLVPKYKGGKSWGGPFELAPDPAEILPEGELAELIKTIREKL
jgi:diadenosine tetraphosphate (Ap4A) HIT family hydrolase